MKSGDAGVCGCFRQCRGGVGGCLWRDPKVFSLKPVCLDWAARVWGGAVVAAGMGVCFDWGCDRCGCLQLWDLCLTMSAVDVAA